MTFKQGDIIKVSFDPSVGHEPKKTRPAVVISKDFFNDTTSLTIVCPLSSRENSFFLHEPIPDDASISGYILLEQLQALDLDGRNAKKIGALEKEDMKYILSSIKSFF